MDNVSVTSVDIVQELRYCAFNPQGGPCEITGKQQLLTVNGPCLLDYLILKLRLPVVLYVSFAVDSR